MKNVWIVVLLIGCNTLEIIDKPIIFDAERTELTLEYLEKRYGLKQAEPTIVPKVVVIHHTLYPTFKETFNAFNIAKLPNSRPEIANASELNVSSQFLVDRDGSIYRLMPENYMARHVIGLNHSSIGIENVGGTEDFPLTNLQLKANVKLVKYLKEKYDLQYLIGHQEYTNFEAHELWLEVDDHYRTEKNDPGILFMRELRSKIKDLNFLSVPKKRDSSQTNNRSKKKNEIFNNDPIFTVYYNSTRFRFTASSQF